MKDLDNKQLLLEGAAILNITLTDKQVAQFMQYMERLVEWNQKINLTAITDESEIIIKHFLDSVSCASNNVYFKKSSLKLIDVGTGAGFPGIPLKIVFSHLEVTLLDSLQKRIYFLNEVISDIGLMNISTIHGRAEEYGIKQEFREKYDIAISRAVANMAVLAEYNLPFVKQGGYFIAMKGPDNKEEIQKSKKALSTLGGEIVDTQKVSLPNTDITHSLVFVKKIKKCPTKYPRKAGKPTKNPII